MLKNFIQIISKYSFPILIAWLSIWFFVFYPSRVVSVDEYHYIENARRLVEGTVRHDCNESFVGVFPIQNECVSKYNLGTSVFFIPAVLIDERLVFLTTFCTFLIALWTFQQILKELSLSRSWVYLFGLFPPFIYYSRTGFSEIFSMMLVTVVLYLIIRLMNNPRHAWDLQILGLMGFLAGFAVFTRYTLALPLGLMLLLAILYKDESIEGATLASRLQDILRNLISLSIGGLPWVIFIAWVNLTLYGGITKSGYSLSGEEVFTLAFFIPNVIKYFIALNLMYPGMLLMGIASLSPIPTSRVGTGRKELMLIIPVLSVIGLYALSPNSLFEGRLFDLIFGIRFLVPVLPLALLAAIMTADKFIKNKYFKYFLAFCILSLMLLVPVLHYVHRDFLLSLQ